MIELEIENEDLRIFKA